MGKCLKPKPIKIGNLVLDFSRTYIMGILNITPDSFSDGGLYLDPKRAILHAKEMVSLGADIIDIGAESSRPGALPISEEEELSRIVPVLKELVRQIQVPISIDTYKARVAEVTLDMGANMINDISGLRFEPRLAEVAANFNVPLVLMHSRKTPQTMQQDIFYNDLVQEVISELKEAISRAKRGGIKEELLIIDPGLGFGKTASQNLKLIAELERFKIFERPILIGPSRKSFIGKVLQKPVNERIYGTAAAVAASILKGANIIRVHEVDQMVQVARLTDAILYGWEEDV
jgi:dihydropteroate synthase